MLAIHTKFVESNDIEQMDTNKESALTFCEGSEVYDSAIEDDFEHYCYARYGRRGINDRD